MLLSSLSAARGRRQPCAATWSCRSNAISVLTWDAGYGRADSRRPDARCWPECTERPSRGRRYQDVNRSVAPRDHRAIDEQGGSGLTCATDAFVNGHIGHQVSRVKPAGMPRRTRSGDGNEAMHATSSQRGRRPRGRQAADSARSVAPCMTSAGRTNVGRAHDRPTDRGYRWTRPIGPRRRTIATAESQRRATR